MEKIEEIIADIEQSIALEVEDKGKIILEDPSLKEMIINEWGEELAKAIIEDIKENL